MEEISPTKEKILQYLDYKGISKADFCRKTGFSYENFKGKSLKSDIGGAILGKIITIYSDMSADWLLTGEGSMLKTTPLPETPSDSPETPSDTADKNKMLDTIVTQAHIIDSQQRQIDFLIRRLEQPSAASGVASD